VPKLQHYQQYTQNGIKTYKIARQFVSNKTQTLLEAQNELTVEGLSHSQSMKTIKHGVWKSSEQTTKLLATSGKPIR
jgi:hypothetical protein